MKRDKHKGVHKYLNIFLQPYTKYHLVSSISSKTDVVDLNNRGK